MPVVVEQEVGPQRRWAHADEFAGPHSEGQSIGAGRSRSWSGSWDRTRTLALFDVVGNRNQGGGEGRRVGRNTSRSQHWKGNSFVEEEGKKKFKFRENSDEAESKSSSFGFQRQNEIDQSRTKLSTLV